MIRLRCRYRENVSTEAFPAPAHLIPKHRGAHSRFRVTDGNFWSQLRAIPGHSTPATTGNSRASNVIRNHMYVDDVLLGADSAEDGPRPVQNTQMGFLPPRVTRRASRIL